MSRFTMIWASFTSSIHPFHFDAKVMADTPNSALTTGQMLPLTAESIRVTFLYGKLPTGPYLMWAHAFLLKTRSKNASPVG